ncbi:unnamed protein product [Lathyrus sativus]|nr:unnamed protein product [Lathyrus sativus]
MNILSINLRGGSSVVKRRRLAHLIQSGKVDICFVQESKLVAVNLEMTSSLWGDPNVECSESGACGASGGIIILWRKGILNLNFSFRGVGFRKFWSDLMGMKSRLNRGCWIVSGDFNAVLRDNERKRVSVSGRRTEM